MLIISSLLYTPPIERACHINSIHILGNVIYILTQTFSRINNNKFEYVFVLMKHNPQISNENEHKNDGALNKFKRPKRVQPISTKFYPNKS